MLPSRAALQAVDAIEAAAHNAPVLAVELPDPVAGRAPGLAVGGLGEPENAFRIAVAFGDEGVPFGFVEPGRAQVGAQPRIAVLGGKDGIEPGPQGRRRRSRRQRREPLAVVTRQVIPCSRAARNGSLDDHFAVPERAEAPESGAQGTKGPRDLLLLVLFLLLLSKSKSKSKSVGPLVPYSLSPLVSSFGRPKHQDLGFHLQEQGPVLQGEQRLDRLPLASGPSGQGILPVLLVLNRMQRVARYEPNATVVACGET